MYSVTYSRTTIYFFFLFTELCILTELWLDYGQVFNERCILRYGAYQKETLIRGHTYADPSASSAVLIRGWPLFGSQCLLEEVWYIFIDEKHLEDTLEKWWN